MIAGDGGIESFSNKCNGIVFSALYFAGLAAWEWRNFLLQFLFDLYCIASTDAMDCDLE